jgi:hypothetical protein
MATSYIQNIYNNTQTTFYMWAQDKTHLGSFNDAATGASVGDNNNGDILAIPPGAQYTGYYAGVPWYNGSTAGSSANLRAISTSNNKSQPCLYMIQSAESDGDGINYYNSGTGMQTDRQCWGSDSSGDVFNFSLIFNTTGIVMQMDNESHSIIYYVKAVVSDLATMSKDILSIASQVAELA